MRLQSMLLAALLGFVPAVLAQTAPRPERPGPHGPPPQGQAPRGPGAMLDRMSERMVEALNLTPAQVEQLHAITEEFRPRYDQVDFREAFTRLEDARASGDEQEIAAAEADLDQARSAQDKLRNEYFDRVETILNPEQVKSLNDLRTRFGGDMRGPGRLDRVIETLPEELQLTPDQRKKFDELAATRRSARDKQREQMRAIANELREAQKAGDEKRVEELRNQRNQARSVADEAFYADLEKILNDQQKAKLAEIRAASGAGRDRDGALSVRSIERATQRLELTKEQRDAIREIVRQAMHELRTAKPDQRSQAEAQAAERAKKEITALLTPEQASEFEKALKEPGPGGPPRHRGERRAHEPGATQPAAKP